MNKRNGLFFLFSLFVVLTYAQHSREIKYIDLSKKAIIDSILLRTNNENNGIAIGFILPEGKYVYSTGYADREKKIPVTENTLFEIGSISKVFTAIAFAYLAETKVLSYNDSLSKYLPPDFRNSDVGKIRLINLANHTSGLPAFDDSLAISQLQNPFEKFDDKQLYHELSLVKIEHAPGTNYEYSNLGVGLLGNIISNISHKSYENLILEKVSKPLGLTQTGINFSKSNQLISQGYYKDGRLVKAWKFKALAGCGAIRSSVVDLLQFMDMNMNAEKIQDTILAKAITVTQQPSYKINDKLSVGLGWHIAAVSKAFWHNGETGGFESYLSCNKTSYKGIVILCNTSGAKIYELSVAIRKALPRLISN